MALLVEIRDLLVEQSTLPAMVVAPMPAQADVPAPQAEALEV